MHLYITLFLGVLAQLIVGESSSPFPNLGPRQNFRGNRNYTIPHLGHYWNLQSAQNLGKIAVARLSECQENKEEKPVISFTKF